MAQIELYGKQLPTRFCRGFIEALVLVIGPQRLRSVIQAPIRNQFSNTHMAQAWLEPLYCYLDQNNSALPDLDYAYTSLFVEGIQLCFQQQGEALVQGILMRTTQTWCRSYPLSSPFSGENSLEALYTKRIHTDLQSAIQANPDIRFSTAECAYILIASFWKHFSTDSGICYEIDKEAGRIRLSFPECPFCLNAHPACTICFLMVKSILDWVQGSQISRQVLLVSWHIQAAESSNHTIVLYRK